MPRLLCLAQAHAPARQPRAAAKRASKAVSKTAAKPAAYTILEHVPVRLSAHSVVWAALRRHATRMAVVDAEHPGDSFPAHVIAIDQLGPEAITALAEVLAERRAAILAAEKGTGAGDLLGRPLDKLFEQEMEWLSIRNLLAAALAHAAPAATRPRKKKPPRALLLIDA